MTRTTVAGGRRRILLVGEGPLPGPTTKDSRFAALRFQQFSTALDEHDVTHVDCRAGEAGLRALGIDPAHPERFPADAVVSAGSYGPTRLALRLAAERPLWIDLPGDPFADAQMYAWNTFDVTPPEHVEAVAAEAARVFVPAIARADRFSTISGPSRYALLGQLGVTGRLVRASPGEEWAHVVPIAWAFGSLEERPIRQLRVGIRSEGPLRVLLSGSLNTWFDTATALDALLAAMDVLPIEVDITGGAVEGHHTRDAELLQARVRASRHAARFHWHGWLPEQAFAAVIARADVGLCLDRRGYEPELGSRTRVLLYLHQGLQVVATARCELVRELADGGFVRGVPVADTAAVARQLVQLARGHAGGPGPDRAVLRARYATDRTTAALREWARGPSRREPAPGWGGSGGEAPPQGYRGLVGRWRGWLPGER